MFGKKKKEDVSYSRPAPAPSPDALPTKAAIFEQFRTNAYENQNAISNYVEFWVAMVDDKSTQRWRIVHYMAFDLDKSDGPFSVEVTAENCTFLGAMTKVSELELMAEKLSANYKKIDMEKTYPPARYPEFKEHFFNVEHFRKVAEIEKLASDNAGAPHQLLNGMIYDDGRFTRSTVGAVVNGEEGAQGNLYTKTKHEAGVLSDIFNASFSSGPDFETLCKAGEILAYTDDFAGRMAGLYLDLQKALGLTPSLSGIAAGLTPEEQQQICAQGEKCRRGSDLDDLLDSLSLAESVLREAEQKGLYTPPFYKHIAECEVYLHLLKASLYMERYKSSLSDINGDGYRLLQGMRKACDTAKERFLELGGTESRYDALKSWIVNEKKEKIPAGIPGFLSRYYTARQKAVQKMQTNGRNALITAKTLPYDTKPTA